MAIAENEGQGVEPPPMGHNQPPTPSAFDTMAEAIESLDEEARNWLDREPITSDGEAEQVTRLKAMLADAARTAEAERSAEKKPYLDAGRAVDAKWKPVIEKAEKALKAAQRKLTPWLNAIEAEKLRLAREAAAAAREAEERLREAHQRQQATGDLAAVDEADRLEQEAKEAKRVAAVAAKQRAVIDSDAGTAQLRTMWLMKITDRRALLSHYAGLDPQWLEGALRERAQKDIRAGLRSIPGCSIWCEKRAI